MNHPWITKLNSPLNLFLSMTAVWLVCSLGFMAFEGANLLDSLYWGITTAVTVGYGDLSPESGPGKFTAIFLMLSMVLFFLPMIVVLIITRVYEDKDAFTHEEQVKLQTMMSQIQRLVDELDGDKDVVDTDLLAEGYSYGMGDPTHG